MIRSSALLAAALWLTGCSLVTEPWSYSEVSLGSEMERLKPGCAECLRRQCQGPYDDCEGDPDCVNYAACRSADISPRGYWACGGNDVDPAYARLTSCKGCYEACDLGAHFQCVGRYSLPEAGPTVSWRQRLMDHDVAGGSRPFAGVTVRACRKSGLSCGPSLSATPDPTIERDLIAWTQTDDAGWFAMELEIEPGTAGFEGVFVVDGPEIPVYRIHHTEPLPSGASEMALFTHASLQYGLNSAGITALPPDRAHAAFQVLDCAHRPARGMSVVPINGKDELALYNDGILGQSVNLEATTDDGAGTGAIVNIDPTLGLLSLEFLRGSELVNELAITVVAGEISVAQVGPGSSSVVAPW